MNFCKSSTFQFIIQYLAIIILGINFILIYQSNIYINISNRDWPPLLIYYHHLPNMFNKDIIKSVPDFIFSPNDMEYQYFLEIYFSKAISNIPIISKLLDNKSIVYYDIYPTYLIFTKNKTNPIHFGEKFIHYLKEKKLINLNNFVLTVFPHKESIKQIFNGYKGCFEEMDNSNKYFTIPYMTNYPKCPIYKVNNSKERNISVFLVGSLRRQRAKLFEILKKINDSLGIIIDRKKQKDLTYQLNKIPFYLANSKYCLVPYGDSPSSKRFYDAVNYGCVPVIISDPFKPAFDKTQINWDNCYIKIPQKDIEKIPDILSNITDERYDEIRKNMLFAREFIRFDNGIKPTNGIGSILWELFYKIYLKPK